MTPSPLPQSGQLNEYTERKEMSADVVCMSLGTVPPGEQRSRFLAVGLADQTVRIISLDPSVSYTSSSSSHTHTLTFTLHICTHLRILSSPSVCRRYQPPQSLCVLWRWEGVGRERGGWGVWEGSSSISDCSMGYS